MITDNDVNCTLWFNGWKDVTDIVALAMVGQSMQFFKLNMCHTVEGTINYPSWTFSSTRQPAHKERCMTKYDTCPLEHLILGSILGSHPSYSANQLFDAKPLSVWSVAADTYMLKGMTRPLFDLIKTGGFAITKSGS